MSLHLVTNPERPSFKELVEMSEAEAKHISEGGYTVEALEPKTFSQFVVAHSPRADRTPSE